MLTPPNEKLLSLDDLLGRILNWRRRGDRIVFTNGCFDLLHAGHVHYLAAARGQGDRLVLGLNSDRSVAGLKGPRRPITPERQRAQVLSGLWCIDAIVIFDAPDPGRLIARIQPDVLVKGGDWAPDQIIGADTVLSSGGRVIRIPVLPELSTSAIIERIVRRYGDETGGGDESPGESRESGG